MKNQSQIIIYKTEDGQTKIDVRFEGDTVWLTQNALAELFQTTKQNISQHIKNIFQEGELKQNSVVKDFLTTAVDGKNYATNYYNLDLLPLAMTKRSRNSALLPSLYLLDNINKIV